MDLPRWENCVKLPTKSGKFYEITDADRAIWRASFGNLDLDAHLERAKGWLQSNPTRRPANIRRFVFNWLQKNADKSSEPPKLLGRALGWPVNEPGIDEDEKRIRRRVIRLREKQSFLSHPEARRLAIRQLRDEGRIPPLGACRRVQDDACKRGLF